MAELGFGGRAYTADGLEIRVEPLRHERENGSVGYSLGFPFATLSEFMGDDNDIPEKLAEYLSCPKRAAAPALYEAVEALVECFIKRGPFDEPLGSSEQAPSINAGIAALAQARGGQSHV